MFLARDLFLKGFISETGNMNAIKTKLHVTVIRLGLGTGICYTGVNQAVGTN